MLLLFKTAGATNGTAILRQGFGWHGQHEGLAKAALRSLGEEGLNSTRMFYVYIIQSINFPKQCYTGFSENIDGRLDDHNNGRSVHTNKFKPWKMIYHCAFDNKKKALDFEKYLKTASGIAFRNKRLI